MSIDSNISGGHYNHYVIVLVYFVNFLCVGHFGSKRFFINLQNDLAAYVNYFDLSLPYSIYTLWLPNL